MDVFTLPVIASIVGESTMTVDRWMKAWDLAPSVRESSGRGSERHYSTVDVAVCVIGAALHRGGVDKDKIRKAVALLSRIDIRRKVAKGNRFLYLADSLEPVLGDDQSPVYMNQSGRTELLTRLDVGLIIERLDAKFAEIAKQVAQRKQEKVHA